MMKKRIISLLLTVAMLISALPIIANADAVETEPSFKSVNLKLDGILGLNVKVDPGSVSDMSGYKVKFTVGESAPVECTQATYDATANLYVYTAKIPAHKLNQTVQVELLNAENEVVDSSSWTLDAYLGKVVAYDGGLTTLSDALKLYATNAAAYATQSAAIAVTSVDQAALLDYKCNVEVSGQIVPRAVLLLNDACTLRVQISADKWSEGYSLKIGGEAKELEYNEKEGIYYYDIKDIRAQDWGKKYEVEIADSSSTLYKVNYAVMSYVYTVLGNPEAYAKEIDLLKAMFLYFQGTANYQSAERYNYSVTYNANYAGSEEIKVDSANITATSKDFTLGGNTFERPGYKIVGWNTKADGTGTSYAVGDTVALKAAETLLSDDFNAISDKWTPYVNGVAASTNNWVAEGGVVQDKNQSRGTNEVSVLMYDTAVNADNYEITVDLVTPKVNYAIGLVFADNLHFRIWNNGSGYFTLYAGAYTGTVNNNLFSKSIGGTSGTKVTITLKVEGNKFSIYRNNEETALAEITTDKANLHGKIGLLVRSSSYDEKACFQDIKVTSAGKMTETLYAQWEELPLFSQDLGTLEELPSTWTYLNNGQEQQSNSAWTAQNGALSCNVDTSAQVLWIGTIDAENYEITANVVMQAAGSIGLVFADNQYFRIWYNGSYRMIAGWYKATGRPYQYLEYYPGCASSSNYSVQGLTSGGSATLKLKVEGNKFTISVNDYTVAAWAIETDKPLTGQFGLFDQGATGDGYGFKDITIVKSVANAG